MSKITELDKAFKKITICISLVDSETIHKLNKEYLDRDYPTDVLSFSLDEKVDDETYHLGDVAVSIDQARKQAGEYDNDLEHEIAELAEHGVLHLLGVHHDGDDYTEDFHPEESNLPAQSGDEGSSEACLRSQASFGLDSSAKPQNDRNKEPQNDKSENGNSSSVILSDSEGSSIASKKHKGDPK